MDVWTIIGSLSLGIFIGWLIRYVFLRVRKFSAATIAATIGAILGGPVVGVLSQKPGAIWIYFVGLLVGAVLYSVIAHLSIKAGIPPGIMYKEELPDKRPPPS